MQRFLHFIIFLSFIVWRMDGGGRELSERLLEFIFRGWRRLGHSFVWRLRGDIIYIYIHTHTHKHIHMYIYIYITLSIPLPSLIPLNYGII